MYQLRRRGSYSALGPSRTRARCWGRSGQFGNTPHHTNIAVPAGGGAGSEEVPKRAQEGRGAKAKVVMGIRASRLLPSAPGRLAWWSLSAIYWRVASLTLSDFICTVGTRAVPFHQALCQYGSCVRVPESPPAPPGTWSEMRTLQPNQGGPVAR